ncbi:hypothetical protein MNBD_ALPHA04-518 [hydrothermal vent metagenome]|uniref:Uncharacterized protein n=1 Tax=hydrothermal vent metagenome TaxID=652676 RepID=A0A3B0RZS3_9ZZZZ
MVSARDLLHKLSAVYRASPLPISIDGGAGVGWREYSSVHLATGFGIAQWHDHGLAA